MSMNQSPPDRITINFDDDCASHIGRTRDGKLFFLTTPFIPSMSDDNLGCEFIALYLFDKDGEFTEARIDNLGPREFLLASEADRVFEMRLSELGPVDFDDISVHPFQIQRHGTTFGFVVHPPESKNEEWFVTVEPGNYMAFHEPWDSGVYDT
jgi:hypothetical protein